MKEKEEDDDETRKTQASILATCLRVFHDECVDDDDDDEFCMNSVFSEMFFEYVLSRLRDAGNTPARWICKA